MPTRQEIIEELTAQQKAAIEKVRLALINKDAATDAYGAAINEAIELGVSYRVLDLEIGVSYPSLFRSRQRWQTRRTQMKPKRQRRA